MVVYWPYLLILLIPLTGGIALWLFCARRAASRAGRQARPSHAAAIHTQAEEKRRDIQLTEAEIARLETRLLQLNRELASAQQHLLEQEEEHARLMMHLDEQRASVDGNLSAVEQSLRSRQQAVREMLAHIEKSIEEHDWLAGLHKSYQAKINRLAQHVQRQDGELKILQQAARAKTVEIEEAQALLSQRDSELRRLIRQRQQREADLSHARQLLKARDDELRQVLSRRQSEGETLVIEQPARLPGRDKQLGPLPVRPRLGAPNLPADPASGDAPVSVEPGGDDGDDLTVIPGLADLYETQLKAQGIKSLQQLAHADPDEIQRMLHIPGHHSPDIAAWIEAARRLTGQA